MKISKLKKIRHNLKMVCFKMPNAPFSNRWLQFATTLKIQQPSAPNCRFNLSLPKQPMRIAVFILLLTFSNSSFAQLSEGFEPYEAKLLIALCNSFTFLEVYGSDSLIVPKEYRKVFTSEVMGMDNVFQVYEGDSVGVINFRGSTSKISSWVENFYSAMIPGKGVIKIDSVNVPYMFAADTNAAVHSGYALTVVLLAPVIIEQINKLNAKGIYNVLLTGHSQGGALAHLSRAYLENLSDDGQFARNVYKTYAFANPMCGNKEFADEYKHRYSDGNMSYSIINPADLMPKLPMNYQEEKKPYGKVFKKIWVNLITQGDAPKLKNLIISVFKPFLAKYIIHSNRFIETIVSNFYVSIEMPAYVGDINYFQTGTIHYLEPFSIPEVQTDSHKMTKKEKAKMIEDKDENDNDKESSLSQHKPYNYYVAILKKYFSEEYKELDLLYLPENLE